MHCHGASDVWENSCNLLPRKLILLQFCLSYCNRRQKFASTSNAASCASAHKAHAGRSLYWKGAEKINAITAANIGAVLFMVSILPGFAACTYIPALVIERPLYYRSGPVLASLQR